MADRKSEKLELQLEELGPESYQAVLSKDADLGVVNASGHVQQLDRQFSRLSLISMSTVVDNAWVALGGTIVSTSDISHCLSLPFKFCHSIAHTLGLMPALKAHLTLQWRSPWSHL